MALRKQMAMLDALMGASRNKSGKDKTGDDFKEDNICKYFLLGFCPDDLMAKTIEKEEERDKFAFTKRPHIPRPCKYSHSDVMKSMYENHAKKENYRKDFEKLLFQRLDDIIADVDNFYKIQKAKCKPKEVIVRLSDVHKQDVEDWKVEQLKWQEEARIKGERGDIQGSRDALAEVSKLQHFIDDRTDYGTIDFPGEACCPVCAGRYLVGKIKPGSEKGLSGYVWEAEHPNKKLHKHYSAIREMHARLKDKVKEYENDKDRGDDKRDDVRKEAAPSKDRSRSRDGRDDRRGASRPRERDRRDGRDRSRSRNGGGRRDARDRDDRGDRGGDRGGRGGRGRDESRGRNNRRRGDSRDGGRDRGRHR